MPVIYRSNKNAWMNAKLFEEFLELLDNHVKRRVVLILDNASSHLLGVKNTHLNYISVVFLPVNTTSLFQPLDCGIIANTKCEYRKKLVYHVIVILFTEQSE